MEQIEEQAFLSLEQVHKKVHIHCTLLKMLEDEEMYWFKRSSESSIKETIILITSIEMLMEGGERKVCSPRLRGMILLWVHQIY